MCGQSLPFHLLLVETFLITYCRHLHIVLTRSGAKKPPTPIDFNPADPLHAEFIYSAACLRASMYGVPTASCPDPQAAAALAANVTVERFRCATNLLVLFICFVSSSMTAPQ